MQNSQNTAAMKAMLAPLAALRASTNYSRKGKTLRIAAIGGQYQASNILGLLIVEKLLDTPQARSNDLIDIPAIASQLVAQSIASFASSTLTIDTERFDTFISKRLNTLKVAQTPEQRTHIANELAGVKTTASTEAPPETASGTNKSEEDTDPLPNDDIPF